MLPSDEIDENELVKETMRAKQLIRDVLNLNKIEMNAGISALAGVIMDVYEDYPEKWEGFTASLDRAFQKIRNGECDRIVKEGELDG